MRLGPIAAVGNSCFRGSRFAVDTTVFMPYALVTEVMGLRVNLDFLHSQFLISDEKICCPFCKASARCDKAAPAPMMVMC